MRQHVVRVALLAVPLVAVIRASFFADERSELECDAMAAATWMSPDFATGDPVEVHISSLRRKIDTPFGRTAVQTVRQSRYRLAADGG
ncbi:hypothetical protein [Kitasatospora sp. NPDC093679]|uniref:hypothetical protein n=1 Tax=Kitasatospora sp. NPDC093679 TaxID=3154983 RepID=UPI00344536F2